MRQPVKRMTLDAMLLAAVLLLSYIEHLLVPYLFLPGVHLGLANIGVMFAFFRIGKWDALGISLLRVFLMGLLFGSFSSFCFSLCGALCAYLIILLLSIFGAHVGRIGVSVASAAMHGTGQIIAAALLYGTAGVFGYLPLMLLLSVPLGMATGVLLILLEARTKTLIRG